MKKLILLILCSILALNAGAPGSWWFCGNRDKIESLADKAET